jgi:sigma-B regulation protein RsbU (phosphoserine phosphatase)
MKEAAAILAVFEKNAAKMKIAYTEILAQNKSGELVSSVSKTFVQGFEAVPYAKIEKISEQINDNANFSRFEIKAGEKAERVIHCTLLYLSSGGTPIYAVLLQSQGALSDDAAAYIESAAAAFGGAISLIKDSSDSVSREYKSNMMGMRQMQAMLFPTFDNVTGLDIGAVYLPSNLMSGNFVDAFYVNEETYQVTACVVMGYDATSSFVGSAVRTLVRSLSTANLSPSNLIDLLVQKLSKLVTGVTAMVNICVYQLNVKTGRLSMSSYGALDSILFIAKKKNAIQLNETQIGKELMKRSVYKDITMVLDSGDFLLFYSKGVLNAETEDGSQTFGISNLWDKIKTGIELTSKEHVQNISQSVFEFINYTPIKDDILILKIKKN